VRRTCSEPALVNPCVHVFALVLELAELVLRIFELVLEVLDLVLKGSDGFIECFGQWIRRRLHGGGHRSVRHVTRSHGRAPGCRIIPLIARGGRSIGLQSVLRIEAAGVLGVFEGRALVVGAVVVRVFGKGAGRHWEISVVFGGAVARQSAQPGGHDKKKRK